MFSSFPKLLKDAVAQGPVLLDRLDDSVLPHLGEVRRWHVENSGSGVYELWAQRLVSRTARAARQMRRGHADGSGKRTEAHPTLSKQFWQYLRKGAGFQGPFLCRHDLMSTGSSRSAWRQVPDRRCHRSSLFACQPIGKPEGKPIAGPLDGQPPGDVSFEARARPRAAGP